MVNNCFGDYYTRNGLDDKEREMVTFCYLAAQGGCEPQLLAHAKANVGLGNDQQFLTKVVLANAPFIGYPRSLNAINVINQVKKIVRLFNSVEIIMVSAFFIVPSWLDK